MTIGEKIRQLREGQHLSQAELERRTGIKREYISKIENNELDNPTYKTLLKIAKGLGINITDLVASDTENSEDQIVQIKQEIMQLRKKAEEKQKRDERTIEVLKTVIAILEGD